MNSKNQLYSPSIKASKYGNKSKVSFSPTKTNQYSSPTVKTRQQAMKQKQDNPPDEEQFKSKRILDLEPPSLIKFAYELIEKDMMKRTMEEGNTKTLSQLEVGRLIVQFINKK